MKTAVDSSVLLDLMVNDPKHSDSSREALYAARRKGALIISEVCVAEITPALGQGELEELIEDMGIAFIPSTLESAQLAGELFGAYLMRGGKRGRVIADFLIGAHAQLLADQLLARDRGFFRDYFSKLKVEYPS